MFRFVKTFNKIAKEKIIIFYDFYSMQDVMYTRKYEPITYVIGENSQKQKYAIQNWAQNNYKNVNYTFFPFLIEFNNTEWKKIMFEKF